MNIITIQSGVMTVWQMPNEKDFSGDQWKERNVIDAARASAIPVSEESKEKVKRLIFIQNKNEVGKINMTFHEFELEEGNDYTLEDVEFKIKKELYTGDFAGGEKGIWCEVAVLVDLKTKIKEQFDWMTKEKAERLSKLGKLSEESILVKEETQEELLQSVLDCITHAGFEYTVSKFHIVRKPKQP